jgi:hypothetical protein
MSRRFTPKVVTANALRRRRCVYLTADDRWTRHLAEAELIEDEAHAQLRLLHAARRSWRWWVPIWPMPAPARAAPSPAISARPSAPAALPTAHGKQADLRHV